jgi:hypothetical protein
MTCAQRTAMAAVMALGAAGTAAGDVIAHWNFNGFGFETGTVPATVGAGSFDFRGVLGGASSMTGTMLNGLTGAVAGEAFAVVGSTYNGRYVQIDFASLGQPDLSLSFATRRSGTGFSNNRIDALLDGAWITVASFNPSSTDWGVFSVDLAAAGIGAGAASVRLVFDGATSSVGSVRIDNLSVMGTPVPGPGALSVAALATAVAGRRRRRPA